MRLYGSRNHLGIQHTLDVNWVALLVSVFLVSFSCARNMGVHVCVWFLCAIWMDNRLGSLVLGAGEKIIHFAHHGLITKNTFHAYLLIWNVFVCWLQFRRITVVDVYWCGWLRVSHFVQNQSDYSSLLGVEK